MLYGNLAYYTVCVRLLEAVKLRLAATPQGIPDRACVVPGAIAWDNCECGTLAVALDRVHLSDSFPSEVTTDTAGSCSAALTVGEIVVQVIRCAPMPQGQDLAPTCAALDASARVVTADAYEALTAVTCELEVMVDAGDIASELVRPQLIVGPEGGCVGSELHAYVGLVR